MAQFKIREGYSCPWIKKTFSAYLDQNILCNFKNLFYQTLDNLTKFRFNETVEILGFFLVGFFFFANLHI